jgi:hypothetical protein
MKVAKRKKSQHYEVNWQDAIGASKIESLEIGRRLASIEENASDKESGEHEEEVYAAPAQAAEGCEAVESIRRKMLLEDTVKNENQQDRCAAQAIEFG